MLCLTAPTHAHRQAARQKRAAVRVTQLQAGDSGQQGCGLVPLLQPRIEGILHNLESINLESINIESINLTKAVQPQMWHLRRISTLQC
jgi:hypothetical protein